MEKDIVIRDLNEFLKGIYMGIKAYERYIQHVDDEKIKDVLQKIQQEHKQHAIKVAARIQDLGGVPADDPGLKGLMAHMMMRMKGSTDDPNFILKDAMKGEENGIHMSEKIVRGDLDDESRQMVEQILEDDRNHLATLQSYIQH